MDFVSSLSIVALSIYFFRAWAASSRLPDSIPWAGLRNEVFGKTRACIRELSAGLHSLTDGYLNVGQPKSTPPRCSMAHIPFCSTTRKESHSLSQMQHCGRM